MDDVQVSVIIPVYNVESYIEKNVQSLTALKCENIEFIYVDDGSTDHGVDVLNKYVKIDGRVQVVHQKNAGPSAARNTGMRIAKGKWILFVDGDDWVDSDILQCFLDKRDEKCDVIWGGFQKNDFDGHLNASSNGEIKEQNINEGIRRGIEWLLLGQVVWSPCVYLYKAEFLKKYGLKFPDGLLHEDMEFVAKVFSYAQNVMKTNLCYYMHVKRENSITATKNIKRSRDLLKIVDRLDCFFKENNFSELKKYEKEYLAFLCETAIHLAILNDTEISVLLEYGSEGRARVISYIMQGTRCRDKVMGFMLRLRLDGVYARLYRIYWNKKNGG